METSAQVYEVELKFRVADLGVLESRLADLGATPQPPVDQVDRYFGHPARDFAATDEALRLRRVGDDVAITWKGPRIDATTKTRREIELDVAARGPGAATTAEWTDLLEVLGFRQVREVAKRRRTATLDWRGSPAEVAIDHVSGLGDFVEIETQADAETLDAARDRVEALARELGCRAPERRSYLELLLASG